MQRSQTLTPRRVTMNLSIVMANVPALKHFLYHLHTGQNGTRLTEAQLELSSLALSAKSRGDALPRNRRRRVSGSVDKDLHDSNPNDRRDANSEGGSEIGILRTVEISVDME